MYILSCRFDCMIFYWYNGRVKESKIHAWMQEMQAVKNQQEHHISELECNLRKLDSSQQNKREILEYHMNFCGMLKEDSLCRQIMIKEWTTCYRQCLDTCREVALRYLLG